VCELIISLKTNSPAGMWERKWLNFCGSILKKEVGSGSKLGSI